MGMCWDSCRSAQPEAENSKFSKSDVAITASTVCQDEDSDEETESTWEVERKQARV